MPSKFPGELYGHSRAVLVSTSTDLACLVEPLMTLCSCCPPDNYCAWQNSVVACCPNGKTCSGYAQPTTTVYQQTPTTVVVVGAATTNYQQPQTTTVTQGYAGQYCKTLVAVGPGLPTTQAGDCGTILIVEADAIKAAVVSWIHAIGVVFGLQVLGGFVLMRR